MPTPGLPFASNAPHTGASPSARPKTNVALKVDRADAQHEVAGGTPFGQLHHLLIQLDEPHSLDRLRRGSLAHDSLTQLARTTRERKATPSSSFPGMTESQKSHVRDC